MKTKLLLLVAVSLILSSTVRAVPPVGTVAWNSGFPKTGTGVGEIDVKFTITPDTGWSISSARVESWEDGKEVITSAALAVPLTAPYVVDGTVGLPDGGATYNLVANVVVTNGTMMKTIRTTVGRAQAKGP